MRVEGVTVHEDGKHVACQGGNRLAAVRPVQEKFWEAYLDD